MEQLKSEEIAQVFGYGFEIMPTTYLNFNDAMSEGDCHALTEVGWHADRMIFLNPFGSDEFKVSYIVVQDINGNIERQGIGIILLKTSVKWISPGSCVFSLLTEYDPIKKEWSNCINPF